MIEIINKSYIKIVCRFAEKGAAGHTELKCEWNHLL